MVKPSINFSIPKAVTALLVLFMTVLPSLSEAAAEDKDEKKELRPWIGVMIQPLTDELRDKKNIVAPKGIFIVHADEDGPAYGAGLRHGDVIINSGASSFTTIEDFIKFIQSQKPGKTISFVVERDGKKQVIKIKSELREYPFAKPAKPDCSEAIRLLREDAERAKEKKQQ